MRYEKLLSIRVAQELYLVNSTSTSNAYRQKNKYYKIIVQQKTSKHYKW